MDEERSTDIETKTAPGASAGLKPLVAVFLLLVAAGCTYVLAARAHAPFSHRASVLVIQSTRQLQRPAGVLRRLLGLDADIARDILKSGVPGLSARLTEEDRPPSVMESIANLWFEITCGIDRQDPATILAAQLPPFKAMLPRIETQVQTARRMTLPSEQPPGPVEQPETPPAEVSPVEPMFTPGQDPVVLILHTHTSESYVPDSGKAHVYNGQGDIVQVGRLLAQTLKDKYGVPTIYTDRIHDQYPWHEAYIRSQQTVLEYLRQYPSIKVIIDVHRDGTPGLEHTTVIDGRKSARVMLVVGTDRMGLSHPNWQKNNAFAEGLKAQMDSLYPGLSLGIIKADARYNQHLCEKSVIAEVGGESCTLAEAETAALELARVIAGAVKNDPTLRQNP